MRRFSLIAVFFTSCIDTLSWSIVFPIFAPLFLGDGNALFSADVSIETRTMALGFFIMAFSLGQFFGAPIIGEYADSHGRKKALLITVLMTVGGLALTAWSVQHFNLYCLFAGRLLTGIFAANMTICLACLSDLSKGQKQKQHYFGFLSVIVGLSFILGAFLGGKFSDVTVSSAFSPELPLWIATVLSLLNFFFILFGFRETNLAEKKGQLDFFNCFKNIGQALRTKQIKTIYALYFLFFFSWTIVFQFTPVMMVRSFGFTSSNIGDLALFMGIFWALGSGYLRKTLLLFFKANRVLEMALLAFTALCVLLIFSETIYEVLAVVAGCILMGGVLWPLCNGRISDMSPKEMQGKLLGLSQSVQSLALALAPAVAGIAYQASSWLPFLISALASLVAGILYFKLKD